MLTLFPCPDIGLRDLDQLDIPIEISVVLYIYDIVKVGPDF